MVGSGGLFNFMNLHLQQIMGTFGGINVVTVSDLFQLQLVFEKWISETSTYDCAPLATNIWQEYFKMH